MLRAGVFSDSHGNISAMKKLYAEMGDLDMILFLGDMSADINAFRTYLEENGQSLPIYSVRGNNDLMSREPDYLTVPMEDHKVFMTHGHLYRVRQGTDRLCRAAKVAGCDIALYGHTHERYCSFDDGILVLNPGAVTGGYPGRWKTAAVLTVDGKQIHTEDVVLDL